MHARAHKSREGKNARPDPKNSLACSWVCVRGWALPKSNLTLEKAKLYTGLYRQIHRFVIACACTFIVALEDGSARGGGLCLCSVGRSLPQLRGCSNNRLQ